VFLSQYELRAGESAGRLFRLEQLAALEGDHGSLALPAAGERYVAGLDLGGDGETADASVLTVARACGGRCEVVAHLAWRGIPFIDLEHHLEAAFKRWRFERVVVDNTGMGAPLAGRLEALFGDVVERFTFSAVSKAELGWEMLAAADTGRLRLYANDGSDEARECRRQLKACQTHRRGGHGMTWGSEQGDDYVASLALCLRASQAIGAPRVAVGRRRG